MFFANSNQSQSQFASTNHLQSALIFFVQAVRIQNSFFSLCSLFSEFKFSDSPCFGVIHRFTADTLSLHGQISQSLMIYHGVPDGSAQSRLIAHPIIALHSIFDHNWFSLVYTVKVFRKSLFFMVFTDSTWGKHIDLPSNHGLLYAVKCFVVSLRVCIQLKNSWLVSLSKHFWVGDKHGKLSVHKNTIFVGSSQKDHQDAADTEEIISCMFCVSISFNSVDVALLVFVVVFREGTTRMAQEWSCFEDESTKSRRMRIICIFMNTEFAMLVSC